MTISNYLCHVVGEQPARAARLHASTLKRTKAFALAIHIPVLLWAVTGYVIASRIFSVGVWPAAAVACFCASLIYLVERLVLATPKAWYINLGRMLIGVVISVLGASTVDLVIFDREITQQLRDTAKQRHDADEARIHAEGDEEVAALRLAVEQKKDEWFAAKKAANCEANGTCGTGVRNVGPVYLALAKQADILRNDYLAAQAQLVQLVVKKEQDLERWRASPVVAQQAGLLIRLEALHQYTMDNTAAFVAWLLFFTLVLFFELMVVLAKLMFGETVDDELDQIREQISQQKARAYRDAVTSPVAGARYLLEASYA